jgi:para-nitrobenzyl esterase
MSEQGASQTSDLVVYTAQGALRGGMRGGVALWRGIPYADSPAGAGRFRPPGPPRPWRGVRDATRFGAVAPQSRDPRVAMMSGIGEKAAMDEDCLTLNVYSPAADGAKRPVVVWLHGGAFIMGAGSTPLYDGTSFATRNDVVVVTVNYRIGLLGFLYLGDIAGDDYAAGNCALLDQIAALTWVRENIAAFGGDPHAITLMGQSAGAISIATLLAMPAARGLFERAIVQSGASGLFPPTRADATELCRGVLADLGIDEARAAETLRDLPVDRLLAAQEQVSRRRGLGTFTPFVDGVTLPGRPIDIVRACAGAAVPLLCGTTRDEWSLFDVFLGEPASAIVVQQVERRLGAEALRAIHAGYVDTDPDRSPERAWVDLLGDVAFWMPMVCLAEAQAGCGAPVWMYRFDWASPAASGRLGAAHALDLPFVWNTVGHPTAQFLLGGDGEEVQALATAMHDTWAAFIRRGDPNGAGLPDWPTYDSERRATLLIDRTPSVVSDPGSARRSSWPAG